MSGHNVDDLALIFALTAQLTEANHTIERLVSEAANTPELLKENAKLRGALEYYRYTGSDEKFADALDGGNNNDKS